MGDAERRRRQERARVRAGRLGIRLADERAPGTAPSATPTLRPFPPSDSPPAAGPLRVVSAPPPEPAGPADKPPSVVPPAASPPTHAQLLVTLIDSDPLVWRRLAVPSGTTLAKLHRVLQATLGWTDSHPHQFVADDTSYGDPDLLVDAPPTASTRRTTLAQVATGVGAIMQYEYDFGDGWRHLVVVERLLWGDAGAQGAVCLTGGGACPPEDCGGIGGYADLQATLRRGCGREYRELLAWLGGPFDPTAFDLAVTNRALKRLR